MGRYVHGISKCDFYLACSCSDCDACSTRIMPATSAKVVPVNILPVFDARGAFDGSISMIEDVFDVPAPSITISLNPSMLCMRVMVQKPVYMLPDCWLHEVVVEDFLLLPLLFPFTLLFSTSFLIVYCFISLRLRVSRTCIMV